MTVIARYWSYEEIAGKKSTIEEFKAQVCKYRRDDVVYLCSAISTLLEMWKRTTADPKLYEDLIRSFFSENLANIFISTASNSVGAQLVFHRRQLLLVAQTAILFGENSGLEPFKDQRIELGIALLMANDQFHFDQTPADGDEATRLKKIFLEMIPVNEYVGFGLLAKIVRCYRMLHEIPIDLKAHPDFIDFSKEFMNVTKFDLSDFQSLCFGAITRYLSVNLQKLQDDFRQLYLNEQWFANSVFSKETIQSFLMYLSDDAAGFRSRVGKNAWNNDFTILRQTPLYREEAGAVALDTHFLAEKIEAGPFWTISGSRDKKGREQLHRFWGKVFEQYLNEYLAQVVDQKINKLIPNPCFSGGTEEVCDALLLCGDSAVLIESKGNVFSAAAKYSGDEKVVFAEIEKKLVMNEQGKNKGVLQLQNSIIRIFGDEKAKVDGVDLVNIKKVYPVLVSLDDIGAAPLASRVFNLYFQPELVQSKIKATVKPLFSFSSESFEMMCNYLKQESLSNILDGWLAADPKLVSSYFLASNSVTANLIADVSFPKAEFNRISTKLLPRLFQASGPS